MEVVVTGGTGFIGSHLARRLAADGHAVTLLSRGRRALPGVIEEFEQVTHEAVRITDGAALERAVDGCEAIAHLAGINYERGDQTYDAVHRAGTDHVIAAAEATGAPRIVLSSYLRARPTGADGYFASKWDAEEAVRGAAVPATVLKPAGIFGPGDQLLTHLARWLQTLPIAPRIGLHDAIIRPVCVTDVVSVLVAALAGRLDDQTVALRGPERVTVGELAGRIGRAIDRRVVTVPTPRPAVRLVAWLCERIMEPPMLTRAGVRMLADGMTTPAPPGRWNEPPAELSPAQAPTVAYIADALDTPERYTLASFKRPVDR